MTDTLPEPDATLRLPLTNGHRAPYFSVEKMQAYRADGVAAERAMWHLLLKGKHKYNGDCPDMGQLDSRDKSCKACRALGDWKAGL